MIKNGEVIKAYDIMIKDPCRDEDMDRLYYMAGEKFFYSGNFEKAAEAFLKIDMNPLYKPKVSWNLAVSFFYMKDYEKAFFHLKESGAEARLEIMEDKKLFFASRVSYMAGEYGKALNFLSHIKNKTMETELFKLKLLILKDEKKDISKEYEDILKKYPFEKKEVFLFIYFLKEKKLDYLPFLYMASMVSSDISLKAEFYGKNGFFYLAAEEILKTSSKDKFYKAAMNYYRAGLYGKALFYLKKDKAYFETEFMGELYLLNGKYIEAGRIYGAIGEKKEAAKYFYLAGEAYLMAGIYDMAEKYFSKSSSKKGDFAKTSLKILEYMK